MLSACLLEFILSIWTFSEVSLWPFSHCDVCKCLCRCASVYDESKHWHFCQWEVVLQHDRVSMSSSCTTSGNRPGCECFLQVCVCISYVKKMTSAWAPTGFFIAFSVFFILIQFSLIVWPIHISSLYYSYSLLKMKDFQSLCRFGSC